MKPEIPPPDAILAADPNRPSAAAILGLSKAGPLVCPSKSPQVPQYSR